jgi:hypothetical protein
MPLCRSGSRGTKADEIADSSSPFRTAASYRANNGPFLQEHRGSPAEYKAGLDLAIERGRLWLHASGTYVKFTQAGSELFA